MFSRFHRGLQKNPDIRAAKYTKFTPCTGNPATKKAWK